MKNKIDPSKLVERPYTKEKSGSLQDLMNIEDDGADIATVGAIRFGEPRKEAEKTEDWLRVNTKCGSVDIENITSFIREEIQKAREEGKREYLKGAAFAFHCCDCEYCHKKNKEYLLKLDDLKSTLRTKEEDR